MENWRRDTFYSAVGAQKWLTFTQHNSATRCVSKLREQGFRIIASDVNPSAKTLQELDLKPGMQLAVVFGNEHSGISPAMRSLADDFFYLPMRGFAESFNMSVASALTVNTLDQLGLLQPSLDDETKQRILLMWLCRSISASPEILRRNGLNVSSRKQMNGIIVNDD